MKIDDLSVSPYNPYRSTDNGQQIGDATIVGNANVPYALGATDESLTVKLWVQSDHAIGGNAAATAGSTELLVKQIEEIARNAERNPSFIRWSSLRSTPHDGWWHLTHASADYSWLGSVWVPMTLNFTRRAMQTAPRGVYFAGGALATSATGGAANLIAGPVGAQGSFTSMRPSAEGGVPYVLGSAINPVPFQPSQAVDDEFKGRCRVFDAVSTVQANPPSQAGNPPNPTWVEVMDAQHDFQGEFVASNGFVMVSVSLANQTVMAWCWDAVGLLWRQAGRFGFRDTSGAEMTPRTVRLTRLSPEEIDLDVYVSNGSGMLATIQIFRGQRLIGLQLRPRTFGNALPWLVHWLPANGARAILYNSHGIGDQGVLSDVQSLAPTTDFLYAGILIPKSDYPILAALHYQSTPQFQPSWPADPPGGVYLGDTGGPTQNAMSRYWLSLNPLQTANAYAAEAELGAFTTSGPTGWQSVADATASAGNAAKMNAGGVSTYDADQWGVAFQPPPGTYRPWVRLRKGTAGAGSTTDLNTFIVNQTDNTSVVTAAFSPTTIIYLGGPAPGFGPASASTVYQWFPLPLFTPIAGKNYLFQADNAGHSPSVDWFVDEMVLAPLTFSLGSDGPADLWQQAMFARTTDMVF